MKNIVQTIKSIDWILMLSSLMLVFFGLTTMRSFGVAGDISVQYFFTRQIVWIALSLIIFCIALFIDWGFFKTNSVFLILFYIIILLMLVVVLVGNQSVRGAESWLNVGFIKLEPSEFMKPVLLLLLAKYFSRRHVEIARIRTLIVSGIYVFIPTLLVFLQPDFGSAALLGFLWLGMSLVGGIRIRHLISLFVVGLIAAIFIWQFLLLPYQKSRIVSFVNPGSDVRGTGYHSTQSMIAVGAGELLGRGIGYGTQSRLAFLPEHETDFIFAAFAEEWGFVGVLIFLLFFGIVVWRILRTGIYAESNFERLFSAGLSLLIFFQASIHIGMNMGILPITGLSMPLVSYGGSGLVTIFLSMGILQSMSLHKKGVLLDFERRYEDGIVGA
ncbi:MAG: rod shape-determining protein RodA [Patescibacteria group bacterium]